MSMSPGTSALCSNYDGPKSENEAARAGERGAGFAVVTRSSSKVGELVSEIAVASQKQAKGIDQVNTAVAQMDKITQQDAANAEESASASEQMNAQAEQISSMPKIALYFRLWGVKVLSEIFSFDSTQCAISLRAFSRF
jgi:hypothetical protein